MDAVEYFKEKARMTKDCRRDCEDCPLSSENNGFDLRCVIFEYVKPENAVYLVEKWAKEHPIKTRQSEFLKMFPNAIIDDNGVINICPGGCDDKIEFDCNNSCAACRRKYWMEEVE